MILEDFIKLIEAETQVALNKWDQLMGVPMDNVLVIQTSSDPDPERWNAYQWPLQRIMAFGSTRDDAISAYVTAWNSRMRDNKTVEDFRFFGPLIVAVELRESESGWQAAAYAETTYITGPHSTEEEAKTEFISMWNAAHADNEDVTDINIDWTYHNYEA